MDQQILLFRRQYLQLFQPDFLAWPPRQLLKDAHIQAWLYTNMFNSEKVTRLPPERYQLRVLKPLLSKIEKAIEDPEQDEISDDLMNHLSSLMAAEMPSDIAAAQQKTYVTFSCVLEGRSDDDGSNDDDRTITILERPHLISGSLTTGFRTWEAALHLGSYLLSSTHIIRGKNVLELGAGTGFLSILCAKHLEAQYVTITDGDEGVVDALTDNLFLNGLDDQKRVLTSVLRWGQGLRGTWVEEDFEVWPYDVVVGADITYDKVAISALAATLRFLFNMKPSLRVIISGAVRNEETFETFRHACLRNKFNVEEIQFAPKPIREQTSLFYATAVPLKILSITGPESIAS
ncbi:Hypothetical protein R9X50_00596300 [Acrodontium crateriforme]|uniref:Uncharacterized protein n=1 Tax=Acrodontium crateriforme TaxID=150365 RepID=A0AAQ3RDF4_9PEZI|nr:Hypothetical protein R9X50_00596300 [Acrodontium crateriforme]